MEESGCEEEEGELQVGQQAPEGLVFKNNFEDIDC